jgi:phosphopantothenate-cysteine ligase
LIQVVVTGGCTIAPIDDVRVITNTSTGRLSSRITEACLERGASVWHVHARHAELPYLRHARFDLDAPDKRAEVARLGGLRDRWLSARERLRLVPLEVGNVADYSATLERVLLSERIDVAFLAMAVSDFEPAPIEGKLSSGLRRLRVEGRPTPKVIQSVRDWSPDVFLVGFKLLSGVPTEELIAAAREACTINHADLTVANDQTDVRSGRHKIHLVWADPDEPVEMLGPEVDIADGLVDRVFRRVRDATRPTRPGPDAR